MTQVTELGYVTLGVSDLAAWKTFAAQVLGLEVVPSDDPAKCFLRMDYWHHRITLVQNGRDDLMVNGLRVAGQVEFRAAHPGRERDVGSYPCWLADGQRKRRSHFISSSACRPPTRKSGGCAASSRPCARTR